MPNVHKSPLDYLTHPSRNSFFISPTSADEIEAEITKLKTGKSTGPFSIPVNILKTLKSVMIKPLETLFNASISTGIVPSNFKLANVIPVHKKGSQTCLSYYRPISLLSIFNKLLEKLMCNRLIGFLEKKKFFLIINLALEQDILLIMQFLALLIKSKEQLMKEISHVGYF